MLNSLKTILNAPTAAALVAQSLVTNVLTIMLSLACGIVTARALGPAGRGDQSAMVLLAYLVSGLAGLGIGPALSYHTSRRPGAGDTMLSAACLLALGAAFLCAAVACLFVPLYLRRYAPDIIRSAQLMLLFSPAILIGSIFRANLEARGDFSASNQSKTWPGVYTLLALTTLWSFHLLSPLTASLAIFVPLAVQSVWLGFILANRFSFTADAVVRDSRALLSYGLRAHGTNIFYLLSSQVDQAFIINYLSPSALGFYAIALTASRQLSWLHISLNTVLLPRASRLDADGALVLVGRVARISTLVTLVGAAAAFAIVPIVLPLAYGTSFTAAAQITRILIAETSLMGTASVLAQAFNATGRPGSVTMFQIVWVITVVPSCVVLVPRLGLSGAAVALTLASLMRLIVTLACFPIVLRRPVPRLLPLRADLRYVQGKLTRFINA
jgi:O-antigen/teichoic acid export membrane protein